MIIGSNLHNFGQFIYHFLAGRFLGKVYYGELASIISLFGIISIIQMTIGLTLVKFIAAEKNTKSVNNLIRWADWWSILGGIALGFLLLIFSPFLVSFLKLSQPTIAYLLAPAILFTIMLNTERSVLQGIMSFSRYAISMIVEVCGKLAFTGIFVVWLGYKAFGAMAALVFGVAFSFLITRRYLSSYLTGPKKDMPDIRPLFKYAVPVLVQGLALTSMYSTDLLLVKHFFSSSDAGIYASLAVLGRVAYFGSSPVANAMFPLIAKNHSHGRSYHHIFFLSVLITIGISSAVVVFYSLFPAMIIAPLFGKDFIEGTPYLWLFGLFMSLLALSTLFMQFYLSIGETKVVVLFVVAAVLQAVLIWFIHPDILTVIKLSIFTVTLLIISLAVYFPYHHRWQRKNCSLS